MLDAESEMHYLFIHGKHAEGARFILPLKPQCPDSYRVLYDDRIIIVQAHYSEPQQQRGSIQEHTLQLMFHAEMRIKIHSLHIPNYF